MNSHQTTIGLLLNSCSGEQNSDLWHGVMDAARDMGINIITYSRGEISSFGKPYEAIYDLISPNDLDGLIVACTLPIFDNTHPDITRKDQFLAAMQNLPIVSYGYAHESIPGILIDNDQGIRATVEHLIRDHGLHRIAFINGNGNRHDQKMRYHAYVDVLSQYDISLDPALVVAPEEWVNARQAVDLLFRQRRANPDAIVGSNDQTAVAMVQAMQAYGIRVPMDVAAVGFDDLEHSRVITPPMTTVSLRAYDRGRQAVNLVKQIIDQGPITQNLIVPTRLVIRESCGCMTPAIVRASGSQPEAVSHHTGSLVPMLVQAMPSLKNVNSLVERLLTALEQERAGVTGYFLDSLEEVLKTVAENGGDLSALQNSISVLRDTHSDELDPLWHQARVLIGDRSRRAQAYRDWLAKERNDSLTRFGQVLGATPDLDQMLDLLTNELEQQRIYYCAIALYEDTKQPIRSARLLYDSSYGPKRIQDDAPTPTVELLHKIADGHPNIVLEPLFYEDEQLGFVVFESDLRDGQLYNTLSSQLSSAIKVALLMEKNLQLYQQALADHHRAEEADRLKSRFLLMVSHEIRTPLALLIGLSEMLMRDSIDNSGEIPEDHRSDLARIHMGARQLDGLMRDVMDLARSQDGQLKLVKKPLDFGEVLEAAVAAGEMMTSEKGLVWTVDLPEILPMVSGDRVRLQQVIFNLIGNAVKYTTVGGVHLCVEIEPERLTVVVSDTGIGIPPAEFDIIFDEFQQSTNTRGFGGLGLGLAICRRLIEMHDGTIGVSQGEGGTGSAFYFTLPVLRKPPALKQKHVGQDYVLLVTVAMEHAEHLKKLLTGDGFQVHAVEIDVNHFDPNADWIMMMFAYPPTVIVVDVEPDSTWGWELLATLKEEPSTQDVPVLFYKLLEDGGALLDLDMMTKPVAVDAIGQTLQRHGLLGKTETIPTILIADDDTNMREMHATMVRHHLKDVQVLLAQNGKQALDILRGSNINLVLLDLMMPELDGFTVMEVMQSDPNLRDIPVIVLTAQALTKDDMVRLNRGVSNVLAKGVFSPDEILEQMQRTLSRNQSGVDTVQIVRQSMAYMHENYHEQLSRSDIASYIGISEGHLTRCFRQEMGLSPITYLNRFRIEQARRLLDTGENNITEVANAVGFSESSYFARVFRKETGISPREYHRMRHLS